MAEGTASVASRIRVAMPMPGRRARGGGSTETSASFNAAALCTGMIEARLSAARGLSPAAALAEQGFLAAGLSLESAVGILDRLSRRFADYIAELTGEALAETRRDLAAAGSHVAALADSHRTDTAALAELGEMPPPPAIASPRCNRFPGKSKRCR